MTEKITADFILEELKKRVEDKTAQFDAQMWIDFAHKLNILLGDEQGKLFKLQQEVAAAKLDFLDNQAKKNVSEVRLRVEATDIWREMKVQEAKCKRVEEFIKISKKRSDIAQGF